MRFKLLRTFENLVTISWCDEPPCIYLKWQTEHDEGDRVVAAVEYALAYVQEHHVNHWWVDLSTSRRGLKHEDQRWVETEFSDAIAASSLTKLAMTPPLPETGQDIEWIHDWEKNTNERYHGHIEARLVYSEDEVYSWFGT